MSGFGNFELEHPYMLDYNYLKELILDGEFVSGHELAHAFRYNYSYNNDMPEEVAVYLFRFLMGAIKIPRGRKSTDRYKRAIVNEEKWAVWCYHDKMKEIKEQRKAEGFSRRHSRKLQDKYEAISTEAANIAIRIWLKDREISTDTFIKKIVPKYPKNKKK